MINLNYERILAEGEIKVTVKRNISQASDLLQAIRETRKQIQRASKNEEAKLKRGYEAVRKKSHVSEQYQQYLKKKENLTPENCAELFGTRDLVYYFKDKANEVGNRYVIANFKKDMAVMKRALERYSVRDILLMIDFIFDSGQDYLDKKIVQPTILVSTWTNTLLPDAELWLEGKYIPRSQKKKGTKSVREWTGEKSSTDKASIGDWGF